MDCCVCGPMAYIFRPPRNTICLSCYEGARCMTAFLTKLDLEKESDGLAGISHALKWMKEMKENQEGMNEKMAFLDGLSVAFRDEILIDIHVKPRDGRPIPAHRALLATRSEIFRTMLGSDECKAPADDTISLPDMSHEELKCLLEFLYSGTLPKEMLEKHAFSLLLAADKYEIPFLRKCCESWILGSLNSSNALEVLEISEACSNKTLKECAMNSIVQNMEDVVFSPNYVGFALRNASLSVEITRAVLREAKDRKIGPPQCLALK
ncbi:hypothetical protein ACLOJK_031396 [Asimina triloba]